MSEEAIRLHKELSAQLDPQRRRMLLRLVDEQYECSNREALRSFAVGFRAGMEIAMEWVRQDREGAAQQAK